MKEIQIKLEGWTDPSDIDFLTNETPKILKKLEQITGTALNEKIWTIELVKGRRGAVTYWMKGENPKIIMGESYTYRLYAHELHHARQAPYNIGVTKDLRWSDSLAAFEESIAHALGEILSEQYYSNNTTNNSTTTYDLRNNYYLTSKTLWGDGNGMNKALTNYEMGAVAVRKLLTLDGDFLNKFYTLLRQEIKKPDFEFSRDLILSVISNVRFN